ncbi:MAG: hypothetical protein BWZ02_01576 [Lentisphaerae bacterium ADurb.BinA184]|nr:MAG: hypothetical protein BWZ02_01576 [Lentisphaerae bacterium ADurb.BinA184]
MSDSISATEAPSMLSTSDSFCPSALSRQDMTCTSSWKPFGNSGRNGRSVMRAVRISFSLGRPSRLKKPPGNLPAALNFSR